MTTRTDLHPIFAECLAKEPTRYSIHRLFSIDGNVYATDGRIAVRCPGEVEPVDHPPDPTKICWDASDYLAEPTKLKKWLTLDCPVCNGTTKSECDDCDGYGKTTVSPDQEIQCESCNGTGETKCEYCHEGKYYRNGEQGMVLGGRYHNMLIRHKAVAFLPKSKKFLRPLRFTVEPNIEGLLMPIDATKLNTGVVR